MKIAMLCTGHAVNDARVTYKQACSLARAGHDVVVFGQGPSKLEDIPSVDLRPLIPEGKGWQKRLKMIFKLYRAAVSYQPDVIVCHEFESTIPGLILKLRHGIKMVFDSHECFEVQLSWRMPKIFRPTVRAIVTAMLTVIVRRSDWVTVVTPFNQEFLGAMRDDGHVDVLHNSPSMELFPPCSHDTDGPVTVVHEGFLYRQRGLVQMLEAVASVRRSRDIRFLIVGRIKPQDQALFDQKVADLGLSEAMIIPGWMQYDQIGRIESQAQIGLICHQYTPNSFLSLNNKLYNYMSCGQAIIAPKGSVTEDMIRRYDCGLCVDTSKPEEIADAIDKLAEDVELRKRFGANGRKAIEEELGWHIMEQKLQRIYRELELI